MANDEAVTEEKIARLDRYIMIEKNNIFTSKPNDPIAQNKINLRSDGLDVTKATICLM